MMPLLLESSLLRSAGFRHGFSTRAVDFRGGDVARESVALALRFDVTRLFEVEQVHGDRVLVMDRPSKEKADALVAKKSGDAVGVRVADCVPVLLADPSSGAVAAVHAGWRGVAKDIIAKTLSTVPAELAAIGPCIGPCCFEVSAEVAESIASASDPSVIARREGDKAYVDLRKAVRTQLERAGVRRIEDVPGCTKCDPEHFFSHRRDGDAAGRHIGVIVAR
jgi:YfiH family protein